MEAHTTAPLSDVTPTGSRTQVITPDEVPEQVKIVEEILKLKKKKKSVFEPK